MLKKIAILLFILLILQMAMYARLYAAEPIDENVKIPTEFTGCPTTMATGIDHDIDAYLNELGIETSVNEEALNQKYAGTSLSTVNGNTTLQFNNSNGGSYKLEIYDMSQGLVASFGNISGDMVVIDKELFASGAYIYKLQGEENLYCGTFVLE